jgi:RHS repeat-associated protein
LTSLNNPTGTTQGSLQTGNWTDASSWLSGVFPLANDNVTINTGHTLTIPSGQIASAGILNDKGTLRNFGTLNMGKIPTADLYVETLSYHIRGGLRGINLDASGNLTNSLFSFKLGYETNGFWDGNIGKQEWKSNLDNVSRSFTYRYDGASRITGGKFIGNGTENYSLDSVNYDFNGNIKMLTRRGYKSNNTFGIVDNLSYTYQSNSNKIQEVTDNSLENASFKDATGTTDYAYSLDGSLTSDANKGITLIEYNYLKLPRKVVQNGVTTLIQYDASGKKLKETIGTQITDYSGNKIYKNSALYQIGHDEGRIINGEYEYNIKDHLGNLRVAFRDSLGIAKISQSYAYGIWGEDLPTLSYLKQTWKADNFKFTGKESLQGTGYIDFGARWYDNLVPRFTTIDPLSELSRRFSPFVYGNNNPLRFIDPDGMSSVGADGLTTEQWVENKGDEEKNKESRSTNNNNERWASQYIYRIHQIANNISLLSNGKPQSKGQQRIFDFKLESLNAGTEYADSEQFQTGETSFRHGMRNNSQTVLQAMNKADKFVREQFSKAKNLLSQGKISEAYFEFAVGLHTLQDATSPAHGGFQVWNGNESKTQIIDHVAQEILYPGFNSSLQQLSNKYLKWFENSTDPLPSQNLFLNMKIDSPFQLFKF